MLLFMLSMLFSNFPVATEMINPEEENSIALDRIEINQYALFHFDSLYIDQNKLDFFMDDLEKKMYSAPINAKIADNGEIISEKLGETMDRSLFEIQFRTLFYNNKDGKLRIPTLLVYPKVDRGLLEEISQRELGSYATFFRQSNKERSYNIELAAEAINNTVVFPGETFSFNKIVGERTTDKGYKRAPVIVKGELAEDIGGGICQVSSTLFNAVDLHGIQIVERYAHSRSVPYVPPGRDATVSWWGPDFVFKNLYNEAILIRARAVNGKMIVAIYSSDTAEYFKGE
ncbi:VanW family protein [Oceanobacillus bengalensis]|uniref:Peptidoglycan binding domain-containing protein n=1 Tax=Oceanobacillus bengalensis TaxID=1435466 RepID=A0A494Z4R5_9BACI|nr:VanW family protein [Oceanobacillus bengalensis]RKQ17511.1 hypothetical protein D8M05_03665 [Oceanobacillus bengalensis]